MATIRARRQDVWEVRVFTGRDGRGRPTQLSRTVRGSRGEAERVAASLEAAHTSTAGGRTVADVLEAWQEGNAHVWAPASRRDYAGRVRFVAEDPIASVRLARLGGADVEHWHARMRRAGVGETAIRGRHSALRAALSQAVRWGWIGTNPAMAARLRQPRSAPRQAMSTDDVQAVIGAAAGIDPAAALALRLAAAGGLRRAELAALRWDDLDGDLLTVDSSVARHPGGGGASVLVDAPTRTANRRVVRLDAGTVAAIEELRRERSVISPYLFAFDAHPPPPSRIGWWWTRARSAAGIDRTWRLHDLRHWSATVAVSGGHDVRAVAGSLAVLQDHDLAERRRRSAAMAEAPAAADRSGGEMAPSRRDGATDRHAAPDAHEVPIHLL